MALMTVTCRMCKHEYGRWRRTCEACGNPSPASVIKELEWVQVRAHRPRQLSRTACGFCTLRGAKVQCPTCGKSFHKTCLGTHTCKEAS